MQDIKMQEQIDRLYIKISEMLQKRDDEAYENIYTMMFQDVWERLLKKDIGLLVMQHLCEIWSLENNIGESTIFHDVNTVEEAVVKFRNIRFCLFRLENDLSPEACMEGLQYIDESHLSETALLYFLRTQVENESKVIHKLKGIAG